MPRLLLALLASLVPGFAAEPGTPLKVSQPLERSVVQRDGAGRGRLLAAATGAAGDQIEVRVLHRKDGRVAVDWTAPGRLELGTGWYKFEFRAKRGATIVGQATVERVGVGEVFITCGQSNSANHGKPIQQATDERVSAHDLGTDRWQPCKDPQPGATGGGGSPWPLLGDQLAKRHDVPVGFISVGVGATAVSYWNPGGKGYARLKQALQSVGTNGARAVLWHQGESDSIAGTTAERYAQLLGAIIEQSRADAGWRIPWGVARASFHPSPQATEQRQAAIIAGQNQVVAAVPDVFAGPETDAYHTKGWLCDSVHFNQQGLAAHAQGWADALAPRIPGRK